MIKGKGNGDGNGDSDGDGDEKPDIEGENAATSDHIMLQNKTGEKTPFCKP